MLPGGQAEESASSYGDGIMQTEPYLLRLTTRLADGLGKVPESIRTRHTAYLRSCQNPDGGFSGREGGSDLYYTGFACGGWRSSTS